ncbi:MAG: hypothetical protein RLN83_15035 [Balneola sp.]|jgi:hypothetical protein|tara:strand:+ start:253859 stop:254392 length:534 start_codon:yes stop_codon:yes gene_type:complete
MNTIKLIPLTLVLLLACSSDNESDVVNPFESEFVLEGSSSNLNGSISYDLVSTNYFQFYLSTNCNGSNCPTADFFISHDFDTNSVFIKNFDLDSLSASNVNLFADGRCSVPFSGDSGTLEITKDSDGTLNGTFDLGVEELNGYRPSPTYGCSQNTYSSDSIRTATFTGTFIATEIDN